jgi:hypothetical protein
MRIGSNPSLVVGVDRIIGFNNRHTDTLMDLSAHSRAR